MGAQHSWLLLQLSRRVNRNTSPFLFSRAFPHELCDFTYLAFVLRCKAPPSSLCLQDWP